MGHHEAIVEQLAENTRCIQELKEIVLDVKKKLEEFKDVLETHKCTSTSQINVKSDEVTPSHPSAMVMETVFHSSEEQLPCNVPVAATHTVSAPAKKHRRGKKSDLKTDEGDHGPCPEPAIAQLSANEEVTTGQEGETVLFQDRAVLFRCVKKKWKKKGAGQLTLLYDSPTRKGRLWMLDEDVLEVCADHYITSDIQLTTKNDRAWLWTAKVFDDEEVRSEKLYACFDTAEEACKFKSAFEKIKDMVAVTLMKNGGDRSMMLAASRKKGSNIALQSKNVHATHASEGSTVSTSGPVSSSTKLTACGSGFTSAADFKSENKTDDCKNYSKAKPTAAKSAKKNLISAADREKSFSAESDARKESMVATISPVIGVQDAGLSCIGLVQQAKSGQSEMKKDNGFVGWQPGGTLSCVFGASTPTEDCPAKDGNFGGDCSPTAEVRTDSPFLELVDVNTEEEEQEILYQQQATLYSLDSEAKHWKELGTGDFKILHDPATGRIWLLMCDEQAVKFCRIQYVTKEMTFSPVVKSDRAWKWYATGLYKGEMQTEMFAVQFGTVEQARNFIEIIDYVQSLMPPPETFRSTESDLNSTVGASSQQGAPAKLSKCGMQDCLSSSSDNSSYGHFSETKNHLLHENDVFPSVSDSQGKLSEICRQREGAWNCGCCYLSNDADRIECAACSGKKPEGTNPSDDSKLADMLKAKSGLWYCDSCSSPRDVEKDTCSACGSSKLPCATAALTEPAERVRARFRQNAGPQEGEVCHISSSLLSNVVPNNHIACSSSEPVSSAEKPLQSVEPSRELFDPRASTWECSVCCVRNNGCSSLLSNVAEDKCVACGSKQTAVVPNRTPRSRKPSQMMFESSMNSWDCHVCCITNSICSSSLCNAADDKCIICGSKRQSGNIWQCSLCSVWNYASTMSCVSCRSTNPSNSATKGMVECAGEVQATVEEQWELLHSNPCPSVDQSRCQTPCSDCRGFEAGSCQQASSPKEAVEEGSNHVDGETQNAFQLNGADFNSCSASATHMSEYGSSESSHATSQVSSTSLLANGSSSATWSSYSYSAFQTGGYDKTPVITTTISRTAQHSMVVDNRAENAFGCGGGGHTKESATCICDTTEEAVKETISLCTSVSVSLLASTTTSLPAVSTPSLVVNSGTTVLSGTSTAELEYVCSSEDVDHNCGSGTTTLSGTSTAELEDICNNKDVDQNCCSGTTALSGTSTAELEDVSSSKDVDQNCCSGATALSGTSTAELEDICNNKDVDQNCCSGATALSGTSTAELEDICNNKNVDQNCCSGATALSGTSTAELEDVCSNKEVDQNCGSETTTRSGTSTAELEDICNNKDVDQNCCSGTTALSGTSTAELEDICNNKDVDQNCGSGTTALSGTSTAELEDICNSKDVVQNCGSGTTTHSGTSTAELEDVCSNKEVDQNCCSGTTALSGTSTAELEDVSSSKDVDQNCCSGATALSGTSTAELEDVSSSKDVDQNCCSGTTALSGTSTAELEDICNNKNVDQNCCSGATALSGTSTAELEDVSSSKDVDQNCCSGTTALSGTSTAELEDICNNKDVDQNCCSGTTALSGTSTAELEDVSSSKDVDQNCCSGTTALSGTSTAELEDICNNKDVDQNCCSGATALSGTSTAELEDVSSSKDVDQNCCSGATALSGTSTAELEDICNNKDVDQNCCSGATALSGTSTAELEDVSSSKDVDQNCCSGTTALSGTSTAELEDICNNKDVDQNCGSGTTALSGTSTAELEDICNNKDVDQNCGSGTTALSGTSTAELEDICNSKDVVQNCGSGTTTHSGTSTAELEDVSSSKDVDQNCCSGATALSGTSTAELEDVSSSKDVDQNCCSGATALSGTSTAELEDVSSSKDVDQNCCSGATALSGTSTAELEDICNNKDVDQNCCSGATALSGTSTAELEDICNNKDVDQNCCSGPTALSGTSTAELEDVSSSKDVDQNCCSGATALSGTSTAELEDVCSNKEVDQNCGSETTTRSGTSTAELEDVSSSKDVDQNCCSGATALSGTSTAELEDVCSNKEVDQNCGSETTTRSGTSTAELEDICNNKDVDQNCGSGTTALSGTSTAELEDVSASKDAHRNPSNEPKMFPLCAVPIKRPPNNLETSSVTPSPVPVFCIPVLNQKITSFMAPSPPKWPGSQSKSFLSSMWLTELCIEDAVSNKEDENVSLLANSTLTFASPVDTFVSEGRHQNVMQGGAVTKEFRGPVVPSGSPISKAAIVEGGSDKEEDAVVPHDPRFDSTTSFPDLVKLHPGKDKDDGVVQSVGDVQEDEEDADDEYEDEDGVDSEFGVVFEKDDMLLLRKECGRTVQVGATRMTVAFDDRKHLGHIYAFCEDSDRPVFDISINEQCTVTVEATVCEWTGINACDAECTSVSTFSADLTSDADANDFRSAVELCRRMWLNPQDFVR